MSSQHSIIEHRANYFFLKMEEDYIEICQGKHKHCKAAILSILEHWMNTKRTDTSKEDDLYVYMSYPQFVKRMFNLYGRNTVIVSLEELEQEGLILKRPYTDQFNQDTFEYRLNIQVVQARLLALPDVPVRGSLKVNGGSLKTNYHSLKTDGGSFENKLGGSLELNDGSFKSKRNVDTTIDTDVDSSQIHEESIATSGEVALHTSNVRDIEVMRQRKTDPRLTVVKGNTHDLLDTPGAPSASTPGGICEDIHRSGGGDTAFVGASSHSHVDIGNEKGQIDENSGVHTTTAGLLLPQSRAVGTGNQVGFHLDTQIDDNDEAPTEKRAAVKIGQDHANTSRRGHDVQDHPGNPGNWNADHSSSGNMGDASSQGQVALQIASQQTPDAGTRSGPASPLDSRPDVEGSVQATSPGDVPTPARRSGNADSLPPVSSIGAAQGGRDHLNGASKVIPKRPFRKQIEKPQLTFGGQQLREWYEQVRECKVRMTDKNVITLNRLADIDEMTQENLKDVLELYDTDKWMVEHNVTVDLQELEKQDGRFTFERGLLAVKRKRRAKGPAQNGKADAYGNDYSLTAQLARQERQQKAM